MQEKPRLDFFRVKGFRETFIVLLSLCCLFLLGLVFLILFFCLDGLSGREVLGGFGYVLSIIGGLLFFALLFLTARKTLWIRKNIEYLSEESYGVDLIQEDAEESSFRQRRGVKASLFSFEGPINGIEDSYRADIEINGRRMTLQVLAFCPFPFLPFFPTLKEGGQSCRIVRFPNDDYYLVAWTDKK